MTQSSQIAIQMVMFSSSSCSLLDRFCLFFCFSVIGLTQSPLQADDNDSKLTQDLLFDQSKLLDIQIEIDAAEWASLCGQSRSFAEGLSEDRKNAPPAKPFTYFKGNIIINGVRFDSVGLRKKGFLGSLDSVRPSLKVKFNKYVPGGKLAGLNRLTLNNNKQDGMVVSQYLSYKVFEAAGVPSPRCSFAKVSVNGESLGVYSHVESVGTEFLERRYGNSSGNLYEGTLVDFTEDWVNGFETKTKSTSEERTDLSSLAAVLKEESEDILQKLESVFDVDAFLTFWATESLIGFWDGYANNQNNFFVYNDGNQAKFHFIPWGTDSAFTTTSLFGGGGPQSVKAKAIIPNRIYRTKPGKKLYLQKLHTVLKETWKEDELLADIDRIEELIKNELHDSQSGFHSALEKTRKFIRDRRESLMEETKDGPVAWEDPPGKPIYFKNLGKLTATFSGKWNSGSSIDYMNTGTAEITLTLDGQSIEFESAGSGAQINQFPGPGNGQPTIMIVGKRKSDGKRITITATAETTQFNAANSKPIPVQGALIEGMTFGFGGGGMKMVGGSAELDQAEMKPGAPVQGRLKLNIFEMNFGLGRK
ncbi:MAG TPA: hypothetical protein EYG38_01125 [Verrucomicrobia bacterium]|nr:hypothetical protein [Verrucomicrobiota bacterium]